ncbi:hypothetical protein LT493_17230 [Streptomyces tricolor]|nr:hypothetical protein [Streptomyces tricolor]
MKWWSADSCRRCDHGPGREGAPELWRTTPAVGRPDKAARAAIARRRSDAIDLRLAGVDWLTIARKLAADPTANSDGIAYPQGYGIERYRKNQDRPPTRA